MGESWRFDDGIEALAPDAAVDELRTRIGRGTLETWLNSSSGRMLVVVTNGKRAMVMVLDGDGDPGEHAVDPGAEGSSDGFILSNGQDDEYPDEDTVPLPEAFEIVRHLIAHGVPPEGTPWTIDR